MAKAKKENVDVEPKVDKLKQEIRELSIRLKDIGEQKEKLYKEKNNFDKELNSNIKTAKELRDKKTKIDEEIKGLKVTREKLNNEIKLMFAKLAELKKKFGLDKQRGKRESSEDIYKQIDGMQFAIQTEVLSFDREKQYMERIKKLKLKLKEISGEEAKFKEVVSFKVDLSKKKQEADSTHSKIQQLANESSEIFNKLTESSKTISAIKKQKNVLQKKLKTFKIEIDNLNLKLGDLLKDWSEVSSKTDILPDKTTEIMDKFKKKKRLTTEDILMLQRKSIRR